MPKNWTDAQRAAINCRDKSLLVCAAAGSGKTATLTERIISSLTDKDNPIDIDRMLIVTFTRAAAAELRQRISAALSDALSSDPSNKRLSEQLIKMSSANICTIDSFYLDIVRTNFDKLGISPSFRTADGEELGILAKSLMEDTIDDFYEAHGDAFSEIAECFVSIRGGANLSNIFLDLFYKTESLPEGVDFLKLSAEKIAKDAEKDFLHGKIGSLICAQILRKLEYYKNAFEQFCAASDELAATSSAIYDVQFIDKLIELISLKSYEKCYNHVKSFAPIRLPVLSKLGISGQEAENYKKVRNSFKDDIGSISEKIFGLPPERINNAIISTANITNSLYELISDFEERFNNEKMQKNVMSFSDIRRYAMKLLVNRDGSPTKTAIEYSERFSQIYIDEYQDVDRVQDDIFRSIAAPSSRFMVGDIKQSIYSFRGAEPSVFASYRKAFPDINGEEAKNSPEASVFMSNNFRCDSTVISFANAVCSYVFSECRESMGYTSDDDLIHSKIVENRVCDEAAAELAVIVPDPLSGEEDEYDELVEANNHELEAKYIAKKIRELLKSGLKADGTKIMPHDIAVLSRTKSMCAYVRKALDEIGIDCSNDTDENYFENPDVLLVLCLLNVIDNPQRDIYLAGLLRSPFFNFSLDELIRIRKSADASHSLYDALCLFEENDEPLAEKCKAFNKRLYEFRDISASLSVDKLLRYLYASDLFAASGLVNSDDTNNLLRLYEYARKFESASFKGLYNFIVYINRLIEEKTKLSSGAGMTNEGKVTLMTIHQSKGLEFPVCFVCNTAAPFNVQETRESLVCDSDFGIAMKISDTSGFARINTPMREALIENVKNKQTEEEMRILYVALTRARERLFVTAATSSREEALVAKAQINRAFKCKHTVSSARCYLDWILSAIDPDENHDFCKVSFIERNTLITDEGIEDEENKNVVNTERKNYAKKILGERFSFVYPYKEATKLPAKISVSALLAEDSDSVRMFDATEAQEYSIPSILTSRNEYKQNKKPSAAIRGTATHLFLQFCDFENAKKNGVRAELCRLIEKKFIPRESEELVFLEELEAFFSSSLFDKIHSAKRVIREQRFNILLPPEVLDSSYSFIEQTKGEFLAVQGVIDLILEDENGDILVFDYKTDRLSLGERENDTLLQKKMTERHQKQLCYYSEAVLRLFGKSCKAVSVYSTHAAKAIEIPLE